MWKITNLQEYHSMCSVPGSLGKYTPGNIRDPAMYFMLFPYGFKQSLCLFKWCVHLPGDQYFWWLLLCSARLHIHLKLPSSPSTSSSWVCKFLLYQKVPLFYLVYESNLDIEFSSSFLFHYVFLCFHLNDF